MIVVRQPRPAAPQEGVVVVPAALGLPPAFPVRDLLTGESYRWRIGRNYVAPRARAARTC